MNVSSVGSVSFRQNMQAEGKQNTSNHQEIASGNVKPKFTKSYGKGFVQKLAMSVPVYGTYLIGKQIIEQDNEQKAIAKKSKNESEEPGFFKSFFKGLGMKLSLFVPFYGAYRVGKEIVEQSNIQEALKTGNNEKANEKPEFWKSWWTGIKFELSQIVPIYGTYKLGEKLAVHHSIDKTV